jgi:hypothetical protein
MSKLKDEMKATRAEHDKLIDEMHRVLYGARCAADRHYHSRVSALRLAVELYELTPDKEEFSIRHLRNVARSEILPDLKAALAELEADNTLVPEMNHVA